MVILLRAVLMRRGKKLFWSLIAMKLSYLRSFFYACLRMPPNPILTDILLKFQVQLHQLTPNTVGQLSKYIWAVVSFRGVPSTDGFTKRYELHYQPKKMSVDRKEMLAPYGCINFHVKLSGSNAPVSTARDSSPVR
jgi:hypothetical protein